MPSEENKKDRTFNKAANLQLEALEEEESGEIPGPVPPPEPTQEPDPEDYSELKKYLRESK